MDLLLDEQMMTQTIEVEKVLLRENRKAIAEHEAQLITKVTEAQNLLNVVNALYPLPDSVDSFPHSVNDLILKLYLQRSKIAQQLNTVKPLALRDVSLPDDLQEMKSALEAWQAFPHKDASGYLLYSKDGFRINQHMIEKEMEGVKEKNRIYAVTPDQVKRYQHSRNVLNATMDYVKQSGVDISADSMVSAMIRKQLLSPFIVWQGYPFNCYDLNIDFILTGKLERK